MQEERDTLLPVTQRAGGAKGIFPNLAVPERRGNGHLFHRYLPYQVLVDYPAILKQRGS
jgi:hypothetical protein